MRDTIEVLKRDFESAQDLAGILHRFFDCLDGDPRLGGASLPGEPPAALLAGVNRVGRELLGRAAPLTAARWQHLERHRLWHGGGVLGGKLVTVVWFEEPQRGLISLSLDLRGRMQYARFSTVAERSPIPAALAGA